MASRPCWPRRHWSPGAAPPSPAGRSPRRGPGPPNRRSRHLDPAPFPDDADDTAEHPAPSSAPPTTPTAPAGAIPLKPDESGWVFIETKSGLTRCQINKDSVGCEAPFTHSPMQDGEHANGVHITSTGNVQWILGNLGAIPTVTIDYKTYDAQGWTIVATKDGTRFQNNGTGHGMFVSVDKVSTF